MRTGKLRLGFVGEFDGLYGSLKPYLNCPISQLRPREQVLIGKFLYVLNFGSSGPPPGVRSVFCIPDGDRLGFLYLGTCVRGSPGRIEQLVRSLRPETNGTAHHIALGLRRQCGLPPEMLFGLLWIGIFETDDPKRLEKQLLDAYQAQHGCPTAFNYPSGRYRHAWELR